MNWIKKLSLNELKTSLLSAAMFFLPLYIKASTILLIIVGLLSLKEFFIHKKYAELLKNKVFVSMILFFLIYALAFFYSENKAAAMQNIQTKISLFAIPCLFVTWKFESTDLKKMSYGFLLGCALAIMICTVNSILQFSKTGEVKHLLYKHYSVLMHSTYFSVYLTLCLLILTHIFFNSEKRKEHYIFGLMFLFGSAIIFSYSRMGLVCALIAFLFYFFFKLKQQPQKSKFLIPFSITIIALVFVQAITVMQWNRYKQINRAFNNQEQLSKNINQLQLPTSQTNSTTLRAIFYQFSYELFSVHPKLLLTGVGSGDVKQELSALYKEHHFERGVKSNFDPHNQFLYTLIATGIPGLLALLFLFGTAFYQSFINSNMLFAIFLFVILFNSITESFFETEHGIVFFSFFLCWFSVTPNDDKKL